MDIVNLVTGAASGIGRSLAEALAARGEAVAIVDLSLERAQATAAALGTSARGYRCDISDLADMQALAVAVKKDFGGVNRVFAHAGVALSGKLTETSPADFQWMFDVNVRGTYNSIITFAPLLKEQADKGAPARFVLTGSENSVGLPDTAEMTGYTATKHAILAMADGLRRDLAGTGIGVTIFCPGVVNTRIWDSRSYRQDSYGGAENCPPELAQQMEQGMAAFGQDPKVTAQFCMDAIDSDTFLVITDPKIRAFAEHRHAEVNAALDALDRHNAAEADAVTA